MVRITAEAIEVDGKTVVERPAAADCELEPLRRALEARAATRPGSGAILKSATSVRARVLNCALKAIQAAGYPDIAFAVER